jgi:hypothetical protein
MSSTENKNIAKVGQKIGAG